MNRAALGFDDSGSDSDDLEPVQTSKPVKKTLQKNSFLAQSIKYKQQNKEQKKEVKDEDPETYQYDELYDEIKSKREKKLLGGKTPVSAGPKYMHNLLEAKNKRQRDKAIIQDLKIQRERELEGDEFKDKETFVTNAYKEHKEKVRNDAISEKDDEPTDMKNFHRAVLNDELTGNTNISSPKDNSEDIAQASTEKLTFINNKPSESLNEAMRSRARETEHVLSQLEKLASKQNEETQQKPKSRLLPRLSDDEIEAARKRYLQRRSNI